MEKIIAFFIGLLLGELIFIIIPKIILNKFKIEFSKDEAYKTYRENKALKLSAILRRIKERRLRVKHLYFLVMMKWGVMKKLLKKWLKN